MGLGLCVGMAADLADNDDEGAEWHREDLAKLNSVLVKAGLAPHQEPLDVEVWSTDMWGYSGLHHTRRCAAHLQYEGRLPNVAPVEGGSAAHDERSQQYFAAFASENADAQIGDFAKPSARVFDHLMIHSDAEGFYLPQRFAQVLIANDAAYGWVGSGYALREECVRIADALQMSPALLADYESERFFEAIDRAQGKAPLLQRLFSKPPDDAPWRTHAVAAMCCARLHAAAIRSIETGGVLVFC